MDGERTFRWLLLAVSGLLTFLLLYQYLTVILGAILLAYLLGPAQRWIGPKLGDRVTAVGLILTTTVLVVVPVILLFGVAITGLTDLADRLVGEDGTTLSTANELLQQVYGADFQIESSVVDYVRSGQVAQLLQTALETIGGLSSAFISLTILLLLTYFLLVRGEELIEWTRSLVPLPAAQREELIEKADDLLYAIVFGNVAVAVVDGVLVGIGLYLTGFSGVLFWTIIAIFVALIPLVGSMIVWVPAAVYLGLTGEPIAAVFLFAYGGVFIGAVDNFLRPYVGAKQADLNPAFFIVGVFTGLALIGVMGLFFGPVVLVMTKHIYEVLGTDTAS